VRSLRPFCLLLTKLTRMQENSPCHIRIPHKILGRGLPAPLNIPNQTNSRPRGAVRTTYVFFFLFVLCPSSSSRTLRLRNDPTHPRPPPPLLRTLQTVQTRLPRPRHLLINNLHRSSRPPPPSLGGEHEDGVERPCVHWEAAAVCEVYVRCAG